MEHSTVKPVILSVSGLKVHFPVKSQHGLFPKTHILKAVDGIDFEVREGETLGVVGESGCGKSTLGRAILRLIPKTAGRVIWMEQDLGQLAPEALRRARGDLQVIFQDPLASLDPRMTIGEIIAEPLKIHFPGLGKGESRIRVRDIMSMVGLLPDQINRYPHEFSGGQCQRIGIARAMVLRPKLIICDEPVSALDVSIQAQIINLLMGLQREFGITLIFISHDLSVVRHISHRILVLYLGRAVEYADRDFLYTNPRHPYTRALISAVPIPDPKAQCARERVTVGGDLPSPIDPPSGCSFRTRCSFAQAQCAETVPALEPVNEDHRVACLRWRELAEQ